MKNHYLIRLTKRLLDRVEVTFYRPKYVAILLDRNSPCYIYTVYIPYLKILVMVISDSLS